MRPDEPRITLNSNQRRHFEVLFDALDRTLSAIESAVARAHVASSGADALEGPSAVLYDLPADFVTAVPGVVAKVHRTVRDLRETLPLSVRPMSQRQTCRALLTSEVIRIEESYARGLRGYGEVHQSVSESLDPILRGIRDDLAALAALLNRPQPARSE